MSPGLFIANEGLDGVGKSTLMRTLKANPKFIVLDTPGALLRPHVKDVLSALGRRAKTSCKQSSAICNGGRTGPTSRTSKSCGRF